jgi:hypothetical protein
MAFTQNTLATVGAQASPAPTIYSYKTDDLISDVLSAGYFYEKRYQLNPSDKIMVTAADLSTTIEISD